MALYDVRKIDEDVPPEEQRFLSLAEGKTVLITGVNIADEGRLVEVTVVCRYKEDSFSEVEGWVYLRAHFDPKQNDLFFHQRNDISLVHSFPALVAAVYEVDPALIDPTKREAVQSVIDFVFPPPQDKKRLN